MKLISLVGEQPIPNLLPILYLKPDQNLLVHSAFEGSRRAAKRLKSLAEEFGVTTHFLELKDAYNPIRIRSQLLETLKDQTDLIFNLTGGTKLMVIAAYEAARELNASCVYYQTEGPRGRDQRSVLYRYAFDTLGQLEETAKISPLPPLLTLDSYLKAHLDGYEPNRKSKDKNDINWERAVRFESAIRQALSPFVDEYMQNVVPQGVKDQAEIDALIRCGNHIGVLELKIGGEGSGKHAVDQLTTIAAREYLGTYVSRFLITQIAEEDRYKALATALRVEVIELREYRDGKPLTTNDLQLLKDRIGEILPLHN